MGVRMLFPAFLGIASIVATQPAVAGEPNGLHEALEQLTREGRFNGAVVVHGQEGVRFARGYGWANPFQKRPFTPDTPADSASLAKPVTAAAVLALVQDGKIELDAPVRRYLPEYPHVTTTVRHLLSHSAGLELKDSPDTLANKSNADLLADSAPRLFSPGTAFTYCNLCSVTLALLIERVAGIHYLEFVKQRLAVPSGVSLRPARLADWSGRAIGYRLKADGKIERFDSWEGEIFYGAANLSISASQLAQWGSKWWQSSLLSLRQMATTPAKIGLFKSGLTLGNWYCAHGGRRCHYLGHHQGFHHMLYWDADRKISVAMLSNNTLAPGLQQRLQRALVAFAQGQPETARRELASPMADTPSLTGTFKLGSGELVEVVAIGERRITRRGGIDYPTHLIGSGIHYVPGLDLYMSDAKGHLQWLTLYEDLIGSATSDRQ